MIKFGKVCLLKNVFVSLATQKRAYVIPVSMGKQQVSDILPLASDGSTKF